MGLRHGLLASFSLLALAASAGAQTLPRPPTPPVKMAQATSNPAAKPVPRRQVAVAPAPQDANVPHTLTEALAATYSNQPALQAERAKLRATEIGRAHV